MSFFKKRTADDDTGDGSAAIVPQPEKAAKFFSHAAAQREKFQYEYALNLYATGIAHDPFNNEAIEDLLQTGAQYKAQGGKPASGREVRQLRDTPPAGNFASAVFEWAKELGNAKHVLSALGKAMEIDQYPFVRHTASRAITLLKTQKKAATKSQWIQAMDCFMEAGAWEQSLEVAEYARELDLSDTELTNKIKNITAQRAMEQGGYGQAGSEGGFRAFIKDAESQQELLDEESLSGNISVAERNLDRARRNYEEEPGNPDALNRYARLLRKTNETESIDRARELLLKGFDDTSEYRFKMAACDIDIERLEEALRASQAALDEDPDNEPLQANRDRFAKTLLERRHAEYSDRVERYPTDRHRKYDLGMVQFEREDYENAMPQFQASKDEPKLQVRAGYMLGRCFLAVDWFVEAIGEFEDAARLIEAGDKDTELQIKYELMVALIAGARDEGSLDMARRAKAICSEIARKNITFRDIRDRRKEVDALIKEVS